MEATATIHQQRNSAGIILAGLLFGPVFNFLWLGRARLALIYFLGNLVFSTVFFLGPIIGIFNPIVYPSANPEIMLALVLLPLSLVGLVHAYRINQIRMPLPYYSRWYIALFILIAISIGPAFLVRTFLVQPFNIPSASSEPNLMIGDYFFVSKIAYGVGHGPQRGDLTIFKFPGDTRIDYVKRVVGIPGDIIQMIDGVLNINGVAVKMEEVQFAPFLMGDVSRFRSCGSDCVS